MDDEPAIEQNMRSAVAHVLNGTGYLPGDGCLITDVVVVAGYVDSDGDHGWCMLRAGSPWATRGLVVMAGDAADCDYAAEDYEA